MELLLSLASVFFRDQFFYGITWKNIIFINFIPETTDIDSKLSSVKCLLHTQKYSDRECQSALVVLICLFHNALRWPSLGKVEANSILMRVATASYYTSFHHLQLNTCNVFPIYIIARPRPLPEVCLAKWQTGSNLQLLTKI